jgi:hypothetical protein
MNTDKLEKLVLKIQQSVLAKQKIAEDAITKNNLNEATASYDGAYMLLVSATNTIGKLAELPNKMPSNTPYRTAHSYTELADILDKHGCPVYIAFGSSLTDKHSMMDCARLIAKHINSYPDKPKLSWDTYNNSESNKQAIDLYLYDNL